MTWTRMLFSYAILMVGVAMCVFPFLYMLSLSLQSDADIFSGVPILIPQTLQFSNYIDIWQKAPFARFTLNSIIIAGGITALHLIFDPLIGYVFAKMDFPGKRFMFVAVLSTLMIPFFIRMIPLYILTGLAEHLSGAHRPLRHERLRHLPDASVHPAYSR